MIALLLSFWVSPVKFNKVLLGTISKTCAKQASRHFPVVMTGRTNVVNPMSHKAFTAPDAVAQGVEVQLFFVH
ncbi:MAG: hypothetical protein ACYDDT_10040 [Sulfuricella sp.]